MLADKILLFPYYIVLSVRNYLYDKGILRSVRYPVPVISIGNITVGGTGKTPAVELLLRIYARDRRVAVISRGYRRKTKGLRYVSVSDDYTDVGDEPLQIKRKFPDVTVVVDSSRCRAIDNLLALEEDKRPELVILDDGFQYRKLRPSFSIVLVSSTRPVYSDCLLPLGRLRDLPSRLKKTDMVIVTKYAGDLDSYGRALWRERLSLPAKVPLLFSRTVFAEPQPVFPDKCDNRYLYSKTAVVFTGIADDTPFKNEVRALYKINHAIRFADHHAFSRADIRNIASASGRYPTSMVITTEKDAQRLVRRTDVPENLMARMFYLPIEMEIIPRTDPSARLISEELPELGVKQLKENINLKL